MGRNVILVPHDPNWVRQYEREAARLEAVFKPFLSAMHHIGSTAVPGILAKPIIDILIVVCPITAVDGLIEPMRELGYLHKGENGIPGRRYFRKGSSEFHTFHIHAFGENHPEITCHLDFRDFLRHNTEEAARYSLLKETLAKQFFNDPAGYTASKAPFIRTVMKKARLWREQQATP